MRTTLRLARRLAPRFAPAVAAGLLASTLWLASPAWALPTVDAVQAEISRGNYAQAETMMAEVVSAKPGSARAHYLYAEILAHNQRFDVAAAELTRAKAIDPAIKFTAPEKFRAFENMLDREQAAARRARSSPPAATGARPAQQQRAEMASPGTQVTALPAAIPSSSPAVPGWAWALGGGAAAWLAWRVMAARRSAALPAGTSPAGQYTSSAATAAPAGNGFGGLAVPAQQAGYGAPQAPGGWAAPARSGMPGGLLGTGMAVAGGVAAGMLAERLFDSHRNSGQSPLASPGSAAGADGGLGSGLYPDSAGANTAARDLQQRDIDVGNGDGWGGDDAGSDGGSDGGSNGGGDGGGW